MPQDVPTISRRKKVMRPIKVPQEMCKGVAEKMCTPTPCTSNILSTVLGLKHKDILLRATFVRILDHVSWG